MKTINVCAGMAAAVLSALLALTGEAEPRVVWWSDPVRPGEAVEVYGAGFDRARVEVEGVKVPVEKTTETGLWFVLPSNLRKRVADVMLIGADGLCEEFTVNNPKVAWLQGEEGGTRVFQGDKLRIFGKCLKIGAPKVVLGGKELEILQEDEWSMTAQVPSDCPAGSHEVRVSNGESELVAGGSVEVVARPETSGRKVFDVSRFGAVPNDHGDDTAAFLAAFAAAEGNGGGVVSVPPGRWQLRGPIRIPQHVLFKGAGRNLTSVYWPDTDYPPEALIRAKSDFGVEDIFFHCGFCDSILVVDYDYDVFRRDLWFSPAVVCENISIRRCVFQAVPDQYQAFDAEVRMRRSYYNESRGWYIRGVRNCVIEDNELEFSRPGMPFIVAGDGVRMSRNRISGGGWTSFNGNGFIFEDNDSHNVGHSIGCIAHGMFIGRNRFAMRWENDRELLTHDGRLCAFMGTLKGRWQGIPVRGKLNGTELEVVPEGSHPWFRGTNFWVGADVSVVTGPGVGQSRRIRRVDYPNRIVFDRPFTVTPTDESRYVVSYQRMDLLYVDNDLSDATIGIQLYGGASDSVLARNHTRRCGGLTAFGMTYYGYLPVWRVQFLENVIECGNQTRRPNPDHFHLLPGDAWLGTWARDYQVNDKLTRATVMRRNVLESGAMLTSYSVDATIEGNVVSNGPAAVFYGTARDTVLERNNAFVNPIEESVSTYHDSYVRGEFVVERGKPGDADYSRAVVRSDGEVVDPSAIENLKEGDLLTATAKVRLKKDCLFRIEYWDYAPQRNAEVYFTRSDDSSPNKVVKANRVPRLWPKGDYTLAFKRRLNGEGKAFQLHYRFQSAGLTNDVQDSIVALPAPPAGDDRADVVDMRIGTGRATGSNVLGPCVPHGSVHPSPDSLWPSPHEKPAGARHGFGPPTSGWWPGDKIVGFSQLHAQGTGGTPSYGIFRYVCEPSGMEILEARPYLLRVRLSRADAVPLDVSVAPTAHGAVYSVRTADGLPCALPLNRRCKLAKDDCVNDRGEFTGNWNPAPYRCFAYEETDAASGLHRISVSFRSEEQAKAYFDAELDGRDVDEIAASAKAKWDAALSRIRVEGVDDAERRRFYSHFAQTFVQPRDRTADGVGWDDHYTLWDTWRTLFPLMAIVDPAALAANVNSFADRFERNGRCDSCYTQGKDYKVGQGGDEADCVIADAWAKKIPGVDWARVAPLLESRWGGRTRDYRERGFAVDGSAEGYCGRFKSGSATMSFAYQDWCCAEVLEGLGRKEAAARFRARSGSWTNVWDASAVDVRSGVRGFARARRKDGSFSGTDPRGGFNTDFYEASSWEYSLFAPHDVPRLIGLCGGREAFCGRLSYALENGLVDFGNEPGFHVPWLFAYAGRGDLVGKWARRVESLFCGEDLPGDNDSGAMSALFVFLKLGFFPVAGQDVYIMHGCAYPKVEIALAGGRTFAVRSEGSGERVKAVTLNGRPHDVLFLRHSEILSGGELVFVRTSEK